MFTDQLISATELNRQPGKVLDMALEGPVTITRNENHFALLKRDQVARLVSAVDNSAVMADLLEACYQSLSGGALPGGHPCFWLSFLSKSDVSALIEESLDSFRAALRGESPWTYFEAIIHEWEESALAAGDPEIRRAFSAKADRRVLTPSTD